jgi:hypothetical protein
MRRRLPALVELHEFQLWKAAEYPESIRRVCQLATLVGKGRYERFVRCLGFAKEAKRWNLDMMAAIGFGAHGGGHPTADVIAARSV